MEAGDTPAGPPPHTHATPLLTTQQLLLDPDDLARALAQERRQAYDNTLQCALRTLTDSIEDLGLELPAGFECRPGNRCRGCSEKISAHQAEQFQLLRQHTHSEWRRYRAGEWRNIRAARAASARLWSPGGSAIHSNVQLAPRRRRRRRSGRGTTWSPYRRARSPTPGRFPWDGLPFVPAPPGAPGPPSAETSAEPTRKDRQH